MTHGYRKIQNWNHWLAHQDLGAMLLRAEQRPLSALLENHYGKHALLIGVPSQIGLLQVTETAYQSMVSPLMREPLSTNHVEGDFLELPFSAGSIDLVLLPHTLELVDNPRQLLAEACRIIKPEGLVVIMGFNPYSAWGLKKWLNRSKHTPWSGHFIHRNLVRQWLRLADFNLEKEVGTLYNLPISNTRIAKKLHFLEKMDGACCSFFSGVYIFLARAKVIPLKPIKLRWNQPLSSIPISTTISGHIARRSQ